MANAKAPKITLEGPYSATLEAWDEADAIWRAQCRAIASAYGGEPVRSLAHFVEVTGTTDDPGCSHFAIWTVLDGKTPVFDIWATVDGAMVFHAGTKRRAPFAMIQGSWDADTAESKVICDAIAAAKPDGLWF